MIKYANFSISLDIILCRLYVVGGDSKVDYYSLKASIRICGQEPIDKIDAKPSTWFLES